MYPNQNILAFREEFGKVNLLTNELNQGLYKTPFYSHLNDLNKRCILANVPSDKYMLTKSVYDELTQFVIEDGSKEKNYKIDWDYIDNALDYANEHLKKELGSEHSSDTLKPFITTTLDAIESYLIYSYYNTDVTDNPFYSLTEILRNGCVHFVSSDADIIKDYSPKVYQSKGDSKNIGVLATNKSFIKSKKKSSFSGFFVDDRLSHQTTVFKLLMEQANGRFKAMSTKKIHEKLRQSGILMTGTELKSTVLIPLKREGLIGSNSNGFYFINTLEDFIDTYKTHMYVIENVTKTLDKIKEKAILRGHTDFDDIIKSNS
jgi:hypothetical protein